MFVFNSLWIQYIDAAWGLRSGRRTGHTGQATLLMALREDEDISHPGSGQRRTECQEGKSGSEQERERGGPVRQTRGASWPLTCVLARGNRYRPVLIHGKGASLLELGHLVGWNFIAAL